MQRSGERCGHFAPIKYHKHTITETISAVEWLNARMVIGEFEEASVPLGKYILDTGTNSTVYTFFHGG
jgi:hypothetical protein